MNMKYIKEYIIEALKLSPLGKLTSEDSGMTLDLSSEEIVVDDVHTGILVSHIDYAIWLEKKYDELLKQLNELEKTK